MQWRQWTRAFDWRIIIAIVILALISAYTFSLISEDGVAYARKQLVFIPIGITTVCLVSLIDYRLFKNHSLSSITVYLASVGFLTATLFSTPVRGSASWVDIGLFQFEPAEIIKITLTILLAKYFSQKHTDIYRARHIIASGVYVLVPAGIMMFQSDIGSMSVLVILWIAMLFFAGIKAKHLVAMVIIGISIASVGWFVILKPYQKDRIISFINPYADPSGLGYNTLQARTTFGSGQLTGTVISGRQHKTAVIVPEPYTDFIFSAYAQKFGLIGILALLGIVGFILTRMGKVAAGASNNFSRLFTLGLMTIVFSHILINGGMNLGITPITGIPFPWISSGGSFFISLMIGVGIMQSIRVHG